MVRIALAALSLALAFLPGPASAIVGGSPVSDADGPRGYTVGIMNAKGEICTGVVVSPVLVMTAAHCLVRGKALYVMALDPEFRPREFPAAQSWRNPQFRMSVSLLPRNGSDIGIVRLKAPLPPDMRPIRIASSLDMLDQRRALTIAGFGVSRFGDRTSAGQLRKATLRLIGHDASTMLLSERGEIGRSDVSACVGDSGGPIVADGDEPVLVGIVSWVVDLGEGALCRGITAATPMPLREAHTRATLVRLGGAQASRTRAVPPPWAAAPPRAPAPAGRDPAGGGS